MPATDIESIERIPVHFPEFFALFLAPKPRLNPHYESIRGPAEEWISKFCSFDEQMAHAVSSTDFAYFIAITVPDAGPDEFRACCDWGNWVFPFDDMFDNGHLKDDPVGCRDMVDRLLFRLQEGNEYKESNDELPIIRVIDSVYDRIVKRSSTGVQRRYAKWMHEYAHGALDQVVTVHSKTNPTLEEALDMRRDSAGAAPLFALVEYAHGLDLPDEVFECPSIKMIERIGAEFVVMHNDMLSYSKEEKEGVEHNLISVCRNAGMSAQAAFDNVGELAKERYRQWYIALAELPSWGQEIDEQVQQYIDGVRRVAQANLVWSFKSGRYFGSEVETISATRTIYVSPLKADLDEITARGGKATEVM